VVLLDIFAEEKRVVELLAPELDPVRTRHQQQQPFFVFLPRRQPRRYQFRFFERQ